MSTVTDETVAKAEDAWKKAYWTTASPGRNDWMRAALEAALPALRRQIAEEIAEAAEEAADELDLPVMPEWLDQRDWFKGQLHGMAAKAREIGAAQERQEH